MTTCPCCGTDIDAVPLDRLPDYFTGVFARVLSCLSDGRAWTIGRMAERVYTDEDGGPLTAEKCIHVAIHRKRREVEQYGWRLVTIGWGQGSTYQLRRSTE